jgi:hypothetical protein
VPHQVAGSADEAVVTAFLHGRDCVTSRHHSATLASQFGVPRSKVAPPVGGLNGQHPDGRTNCPWKGEQAGLPRDVIFPRDRSA